MVVFTTIEQLEREPNLPALLAAYGAESSIDGMPPYRADMNAYRGLESAGLLHPFAAYEGEDLVGILLLLVSALPHYSAKVGTTESFFVLTEHRKAGHGLRLMRAAEVWAAQNGAVGIFVSAPRGGKLAEVMDAIPAYAETNRVFFKGLGDE